MSGKEGALLKEKWCEQTALGSRGPGARCHTQTHAQTLARAAETVRPVSALETRARATDSPRGSDGRFWLQSERTRGPWRNAPAKTDRLRYYFVFTKENESNRKIKAFYIREKRRKRKWRHLILGYHWGQVQKRSQRECHTVIMSCSFTGRET